MSQTSYKENGKDMVFSKAVRAGKRTYFFDVKATRNDDLYLTITESKKRFNKNGSSRYEKHKLFLYKEDFDKFEEGLEEAMAFIQSKFNGQEENELTPTNGSQPDEGHEPLSTQKFTDVDFEDLDK